MTVQNYVLSIDGPLLRQQRQLLIAREADLLDTEKFSAEPGELAAVRGLIELTDAIADQAHDKYGIDSLLAPEDSDTGKVFRVAAISENANSFGLVGHVLMAADGEAYEVGRNLSARPVWKRFNLVHVVRSAGGDWDWAKLGVELPRALPKALPGVVQEIWSEKAS